MSNPTFKRLVERMIEPPSSASDSESHFTDQVKAAVCDGISEALETFKNSEDQPAAPPSLMDVKEVARYLNVSERFVESLISAGELTPIRIRSLRRFTPEAVDAYLRTCTVKRRSR